MMDFMAEHLTIRYGERIILDGVCLGLSKGEFVGLLGANGSGKSTLLRAFTGFRRPDGGTVRAYGRSLQSHGAKRIARMVAYVPQDTRVDFDFTVRQIVEMGRHPHQGRLSGNRQIDREIVARALRAADVEALADRSILELSGGQRQMVFIAKALAQEPELLVLDEPVSALDIRYQLRVLEMVRRVSDQGVAAIAALHDLNLAARYCHRIVVLNHGRILADGQPHEVLNEQNIELAYGVRALVRQDPELGTVQVAAIDATDIKIAGFGGERNEAAV